MLHLRASICLQVLQRRRRQSEVTAIVRKSTCATSVNRANHICKTAVSGCSLLLLATPACFWLLPAYHSESEVCQREHATWPTRFPCSTSILELAGAMCHVHVLSLWRTNQHSPHQFDVPVRRKENRQDNYAYHLQQWRNSSIALKYPDMNPICTTLHVVSSCSRCRNMF